MPNEAYSYFHLSVIYGVNDTVISNPITKEASILANQSAALIYRIIHKKPLHLFDDLFLGGFWEAGLNP